MFIKPQGLVSAATEFSASLSGEGVTTGAAVPGALGDEMPRASGKVARP
ncbi:hypothetical protein [Comamonas suwonensis]|uniref:Uncharacterized protein n=1 Tax=Comamonas suwonensis TaxID=2606214 RepID=A0A843B6Y0_9BURK|nr:hypothetical protein [Comamonas suwonensis]